MKEEDKMRSKVGNCFYIVVPKLFNLTNQNGVKSEIITSSPIAAGPKEKNQN